MKSIGGFNFGGAKYINPWTYMQIHTATFDMWQYLETILPLVESLRSSLQYEVYFMGSAAAGGQ